MTIGPLVWYSSTATSLYLHGYLQCHEWLLLTAIRVHIYLLYRNVEPCDCSMQYGEAMNVKYAAPMKTKFVKE